MLVFSISLMINSFGNTLTSAKIEPPSRMEIPFEYYNGLIKINVKINGVKLKFIYDTGAEHTILTNNEIAGILNLKITRELDIKGADLKNNIKAYITQPIVIELFKTNTSKHKLNFSDDKNEQSQYEVRENKISFSKQTQILILDSNIFSDDLMTSDISGIIGASFFDNVLVEIDYKKAKIILYLNDKKVNFKGFEKIDSYFAGNKPHIITDVKINEGDTSSKANLLLDTGCSIPILLLEKTDETFKRPENSKQGQLGIGLGGEISGWIGLTNTIRFNDFEFKNMITKFHSPDTNLICLDNTIRDGLIGNEMMKNFTVLIDYRKKELYFKPNKNYNKKTKNDRSGLTIFATGTDLNEYYVKSVIKDSPASEAEILSGDKIIKIGNLSSKFWTLERITKTLKKKEGKKIKMVILRQDKKIKKEFHLREMF
ncbi:MAG: aspartyl protease family protein [Saprospiraceae bacterium]